MKVVIYCRVSTDDKGQDPQVQLDKCRTFCELNNHIIIGEFIDNGISGRIPFYERPEGKRMNSIIKRYENTQIGLGIVCFAVDRFSRQDPIKILPLLNDLKNKNILFISVTEPAFNLTGAMAQPMQYLLTWFSSYFLEQHISKVKAGMDKAKLKGTKSGKAIGKPRKADYELIIKRYDELKSISQVAKELQLSKSSVVHALRLVQKEQLNLSTKKEILEVV